MTDKTISPTGGPLRRRMTEDMTVRGFTASTQRGYLTGFICALCGPTARRGTYQLIRINDSIGELCALFQIAGVLFGKCRIKSPWKTVWRGHHEFPESYVY